MQLERTLGQNLLRQYSTALNQDESLSTKRMQLKDPELNVSEETSEGEGIEVRVKKSKYRNDGSEKR